VTDAAGLTPIEAAERRQALLEANDAPTLARYESKGMDVKSLIEGGKRAAAWPIDGAASTRVERTERFRCPLDAVRADRASSSGHDASPLRYLVKLLHDVQAAGSWAKYEASL